MDYNSLSDDDLIALSKKNYDALSDDGLLFLSKAKPKGTVTGFGEAWERNAVKAATNISGGLGKYLGFPGGSDEQTHAAVETQLGEMKPPEHWYSPESLGAVAGQASVALPAMAAAAPLSAAGTAVGLGGLGNAALVGLGGSLLTAPGAAFDAETSAKKYTDDPALLNQIAANAAGWEIAGNMLPGQGGLLGRAVKGATQNIGANVASDYSHNLITSDADERLQKDPWNTQNLITAGVMGATLGAATGSRPGERWLGKNETPTPAPKNPYNTYEKDTESFDWKLDEDIRRQVDVLTSEEKSIRDQLARQTDPNGEYAQQLQLDLRNISNNRIELEKVLGQEEIKVGETGKPVDVEAENARKQVSSLEQEAARLAEEYQALQKKGAALTPEEKAHKQILQDRIEDLDAQQMDLIAKGFGEEVEPPIKTWDTLNKEGTTTLYRGESIDNDIGGQWWTTDKKVAERYGKVTEVTLPDMIIAAHAAKGHNGSHEFVFPNKRPTDLVAKTPQQQEVNPFVEEARTVTESPEIAAATQGMTTKQKSYYLSLKEQLDYFKFKQEANKDHDYSNIIKTIQDKMDSLSRGPTNPKHDFIAANNRREVHATIANTDMSKWDVNTLQKAMDHKEKKIVSTLDNYIKLLNKGDPQSMDHANNLKDLADLMQAEHDLMRKELESRIAKENAQGNDLTVKAAWHLQQLRLC